MMVNGYDSYTSKPSEVDTTEVFPYTYIIECFVCGIEDLAVKSAMPDGWKRVKNYGYILCPDCVNKLRERIKA